MPARACLLLLATCAHAHMVGKELVCQDPDTGTLHGINTTWRSTTFCGNYTCKTRLIGTTQAPKIMVNLFHPEGKTSESNNENNHTDEFGLTKTLPELSKDNDDRLLNNAEIKKIIELLHTVKKSDLEAVVELYNVAKEFYKDMKVSDVKPHNSEKPCQSRQNEDLAEKNVNKISYWHEPLSGHKKVVDMKTEGSENKEKAIYPYRSPYLQPYFYSQSNLNYPGYFNGPALHNGDVGRLEYYNSQVNQRSVPYYLQQTTTSIPQSSCNHCPVTYQHQWPMPANYQQRVNKMPPYPSPFYKFNRGYNNNYKGNPWAHYERYKNFLYPYQYQTTPQIQQNSQTPTVEDAAEKKVPGDEHKLNTGKDDSWKTDPLSDDIIQEIRANVAQRSKLLSIPFKKRIKLERAAKVIKLDKFTRKTRSTSNEAMGVDKNMNKNRASQEENKEHRSNHENKKIEVYIVKVTCEPPAEPGYFQMGNMTRPFPDCCPQKIEDKL